MLLTIYLYFSDIHQVSKGLKADTAQRLHLQREVLERPQQQCVCMALLDTRPCQGLQGRHICPVRQDHQDGQLPQSRL